MKFRFPIVIIDEDYRAENTSELDIRALAKAIEDEGFEVVGATSYGDLAQFAQQQRMAVALDVDALLITGDLFDDDEMNVAAAERIDTFWDRFPHGIWFCYGNHE